MSRHSQPGPDDGLPSIPQAPDRGAESESRRPRSPYAAPFPVAPSAPGATSADTPGSLPWSPDEPATSVGDRPDHPWSPEEPAIPAIDRPPLDTVSVAAIATGAVGLGPVAVVLGAVGLRRTTKRWLRSPQLAGVGLGLGILGTLGWIGLGVAAGLGAFSGPDLTVTPGDVPSARTVHASALAPGNCVETVPPQQEVGELRLLPCAQAHLAQVIAVADYPADTYPGQEPALETATQWCTEALAAEGFHAEAFLAWPIVPTPAAWDEEVRTMACLARSSLGPITGDLM